MKLPAYEHKAQYYETDQMGIIHHSNYIRWFEEARVSLMEQMGVGYDRMEAEGIMSPVLAVTCEYKSMTRFGETVDIHTEITKYDGIRLELSYEIMDHTTCELRCRASSRHCFMEKDGGNLVSLKKSRPKFHTLFMKAIAEAE
ncbi:YbgC/FadM family acyl-CoA thioesterase [Lactonifactor sp. BIOML-A3]|uniref:acyl-CoA thioesterase n=1 Tax=Lactonifactor TaxID=420345 RepID=UPI0012B0A0D7|nr:MULTISPECIES: acyl-CoA thioesterase [Lactonifactor]MCB5712978.1 acyl-CoA thioesterase [Lactonifactor longoviformis]MCB5717194.1 acyl-CoA thioesterase [Lactonifactor longoviformis]MSA03502.1 YbgC/FadM family acyl-CoA thioesterase [Lactonifactor sp. BIOML-A5]MSA09842.1 YbgC/FadM family acyl-CoA thioesterase [Lactonifactor sp. BIOML-A4]MSA14454.1 YbgC/FadM family acyl-CoA thioesterase [Lactonifactor sp. BIOML-A3]